MGNVTSTGRAGGITGDIYSEEYYPYVTNCYNAGNVSGTYCGGILGLINAAVSAKLYVSNVVNLGSADNAIVGSTNNTQNAYFVNCFWNDSSLLAGISGTNVLSFGAGGTFSEEITNGAYSSTELIEVLNDWCFSEDEANGTRYMMWSYFDVSGAYPAYFEAYANVIYNDTFDVENLNPKRVKISDEMIVLQNLQDREGYEFVGWQYMGEALMEGFPITSVDEDYELTALWTAVSVPTDAPSAPIIPIDPEPVIPEPTKEGEATIEKTEGGYIVDGEFSDGKVYETLEEALAAQEENNAKVDSKNEVAGFTEETFSDLPGTEGLDVGEKYKKQLENLEKTEDGFKVGDEVFETLEEALARIERLVKESILDTVQQSIVEVLGNQLKQCYGEKLSQSIGLASKAVDDVTLDNSANLSAVYAEAMREINATKSVEGIHTRVAESFNGLIESGKYTEESLETLRAEIEKILERIKLCENTEDALKIEREWEKEQREKLRIINAESEDGKGVISIDGGFILGVVSSIDELSLSDEEKQLLIEKLSESENLEFDGSKTTSLELKLKEVLGKYEIELKKGDEKYDFEGKCRVVIKLPDSVKEFSGYALLFYNEETKKLEYYKAVMENGEIVVYLPHLSEYYLVATKPVSLLYALIPLSVLTALAVLYLRLGKKEKQVGD